MLGKILVGRAIVKSGVAAGIKKAREKEEREERLRQIAEEDPQIIKIGTRIAIIFFLAAIVFLFMIGL